MARAGRRDRHGRGLRGPLLRREVALHGSPVTVPAAGSSSERFDELVHDARERLERRWASELEAVLFGVVDVPHLPAGVDLSLDPDVVVDDTAGGPVPLGRAVPAGGEPAGTGPPRVVVYRRPLEARAGSRLELAELVHDVVVDCVARLLGRDPDEVDPPSG